MTTTIVTRSGKGSPLTNTELDANFTNLKTTADAALPAAGGVIGSSVTATTQQQTDNSTKLATTAYVRTAISNLIDSAPATLDTLNELAAALNDDDDFSTTVTNSIATKLSSSAVSTFGGTLIDDADAATARTTLGLGTAATSATGDFLAISGGTLTGTLAFGDSTKLKFGNSQDLEIYHDGSNSIIADTGTGGLNIRGSDFVKLQTGDGAETMVFAQANGTVQLKFDNSTKLETTSTGIDVTGTISSGAISANAGTTNTVATFTSTDAGAGINLTDNSGTSTLQTNGANLRIGVDEDGAVSSSAIQFRVDGSTKATLNDSGVFTCDGGVVVDNITIDGTEIDLSSGDLTLDVAGDIILDADGGDIRFSDGGTQFGIIFKSGNDLALFSNISDGDLLFRGNDGGSNFTALTLNMSDAGTAIFNHDIKLGDNGKANFGTSDDLQIYHDGSNSFISEVGEGSLKIQSTSGLALQDSSGNNFAVFTDEGTGGKVELYKSSTVRLTTTTSGIDVTGDVNATGHFIADTHFKSSDGNATLSATGGGGIFLRPDGNTNTANQVFIESGTGNATFSGTISSGAITSSGASSGRYTGLEVVNTTNAAGTETAIGLGVVSASNSACDVKLVANRVASNFGSDFFIEQTDSSGSQQETFRISEQGNVNIPNGSLMIGATTAPNYSLDVDTVGHNSTGELLITGGNSASNDYTQTSLLKLRATSINPNQPNHNQHSSVAEIRLNHQDLAGNASSGNITFFTNPSNNINSSLTQRMVIDNSGRLGLGISSPVERLHVHQNSTSASRIRLSNTDGYLEIGTNNQVSNLDSETHTFRNEAGSTEYMRIDSSGNFLVGKTTQGLSNAGFEIAQTGQASATQSGASCLRLNRLTSDGEILQFRKAGVTVGNIATVDGDLTIFSSASGHKGLRFGNGYIAPTANSTNIEDNAVDLGLTIARFKDLYLSRRVNFAGNAGNHFVGFDGVTDCLQLAAKTFIRFQINANYDEAARIDANGNLLVGKTAAGTTNTAGHELKESGIVVHTTDNTTTMYLNRKTSDGNLIEFRKSNSAVGSIGTLNGNLNIISNDVGLTFAGGNDSIIPTDSDGSYRGDAIDLGHSTQKFKDLHLSGTSSSAVVHAQSGSASAPSLGFSTDTNTGLFKAASDALAFSTGGTERARFDSSGNFLVGTTSSYGDKLNINGTGHFTSNLTLSRQTNDSGSTGLILEKTRNTSVNGNTVVQAGDQLGYIAFRGNDGDQFLDGAFILSFVDGTPSNNDMPTNLQFWTTSDGASSPSERVRIDSSGTLILQSGNKLQANRADNSRNVQLFCDNNFGTIETSTDPIKIASQVYTRFDTSGTEQMRLTSTGLGIGDSNPSSKLSVKGSVNNDDISIVINNTFDDNSSSSSPRSALILGAASNNAYFRCFGAPADTASNHKIDLGSTASGSFLTFSPSGSERMRIHSNGAVGIGTTTTTGAGGLIVDNDIKTNSRFGVGSFGNTSNPAFYVLADTDTGIYFPDFNHIGFVTGGVERLHIDNNGNVGIGTDTPDEFGIGNAFKYLAVGGDKPGILNLVDDSVNGSYLQFGTAAGVRRASIHATSGSDLAFTVNASNSGISLTEAVRIKKNGNLLIGKTADNDTSAGIRFQSDGGGAFVRNDNVPLTVHRLTADGNLIEFRKDNVVVGQIKAKFTDMIIGTSDVGVRFDDNVKSIIPFNVGTSASNDGTTDLGVTNARFKDAHFSGAVNITNASGGSYFKAVQTSNNANAGYYMQSGSHNWFTLVDTAGRYQIYDGDAVATRVLVDTAGKLLIGGTTSSASGTTSFSASGAGQINLNASSTAGQCLLLRRVNHNGNAITFENADEDEVGSITMSSNATAYNTSSDARLKDNIEDADDSGEKIDAIQVRKFDWKSTGKHQNHGMIAQELQKIVPEAVSGDAKSEEMMGIDYSKLVPMLVKEIQSLRQRVAQLEE